jgi:hypothetical protein
MIKNTHNNNNQHSRNINNDSLLSSLFACRNRFVREKELVVLVLVNRNVKPIPSPGTMFILVGILRLQDDQVTMLIIVDIVSCNT